MKTEKRTIKYMMLITAALMMVGGAVYGAASATSDSPLGTAGVGKAEVSLGDFVADSLRAALGTNFAFVSASELKDRDVQIPRGKVQTADIMPYIAYSDDPIVEVRLTGRQIKLALERSVLISPQKNLGFLQVSGLKFSYDQSRPAENRVTSIRAIDGDRPISDTEAYSVAMTSSMANGALGYWKIWTKNDIRPSAKQMTIPQAVEAFLAARGKINYSNLNRINGG